MKKVLLLFVFIAVCNVCYAQYGGGVTYTPEIRDVYIPNNQGYYPQPAPTYNEYRQPEVKYRKITAVSEDGMAIRLRITLTDGNITKFEYYNNDFGWQTCLSVSRTSNYSLDSIEKQFDFKVKTSFSDNRYYYF
ncbi:MAG: hypothetical protein IKC78_08120 [Alistipes sp.]|nr:hypothetical protein [Rikenellaceae bacterium]MBR7097730.1 hypothetical protein [Alistipes sp.]